MRFHPTVPALDTISTVNNITIGTAVEVGDLVYLSGFVYMDPDTGAVRADAPFEESARGTLSLIAAVLGDLGLTLDHVIKVSAFVSDPATFAQWSAVFNDVFSEPRPLRTTLVAGILGGSVELEVIAARTTRADSLVAPGEENDAHHV